MQRRKGRSSSEARDVFEVGTHTSVPDYAMFRLVCKDVANELGISAELVSKLYRQFIHYSLKEVFPEPNPRNLPNDKLLHPRRIMTIPGIASLEVTEKSLKHWHYINDAIQAKKNNSK